MGDLIDEFVAELHAAAPDIEVAIDRSDDPRGESFIDLRDRMVFRQVSYRPSRGFGLYTVETAFGQAPNEIVATPRKAAARFLAMRDAETVSVRAPHSSDSSTDRLAGRPLARMNGVGNAIVVLDLRGCDHVVTAEEARAIVATPRLGFDQLMVIHDPQDPETDAFIRIYNTDGSASGACGNGTRCVAWFMLRGGDRDTLLLTTSTARIVCRRVGDWHFSIDMGEPRFGWGDIPLRDEDADPRALDLGGTAPGPAFALGIGNPHAVFFVPDTDALDLAVIGPPIEHAPVFPERANVSFAQIIDRSTIKLRVWERGAGATLGCGTGACASLVAAAATGRTDRTAHVDLPGGRLEIAWGDDNHVVMTGPVELEFEGPLDARRLADRAA